MRSLRMTEAGPAGRAGGPPPISRGCYGRASFPVDAGSTRAHLAADGRRPVTAWLRSGPLPPAGPSACRAPGEGGRLPPRRRTTRPLVRLDRLAYLRGDYNMSARPPAQPALPPSCICRARDATRTGDVG